MDKAEILNKIKMEAKQGELIFPTSVKKAIEVKRILDDPSRDLDAAARLLKSDPLLSARVVAVANSSAFNRSRKAITNVPAAITLLGLFLVKSLILGVAVRQIAESTTTAKQELIAQLWKHSAYVGSIAQVIARRVTKHDPETALFAGMIHEICWFYLLFRTKDYPDLFEGDISSLWNKDDEIDNEGEFVGEIEVGTLLLKALEIPDSVIDTIIFVWRGYQIYPPTSQGAVLLIADQLAPIQSPFTLPIYQTNQGQPIKLDLFFKDYSLSDVIAESEEEVDSLTNALCF